MLFKKSYIFKLNFIPVNGIESKQKLSLVRRQNKKNLMFLFECATSIKFIVKLISLNYLTKNEYITFNCRIKFFIKKIQKLYIISSVTTTFKC